VAIEIKSAKEIEAMRVVGRMAAETLVLVGEKLRAGMTTEEINALVHEDTIRRGARPAPLNYKGFPKSVCTSINDVVCHGIPAKQQVLKDGDIINVDITTFYEGFHGDTSATFYIGVPSQEARHVTETARRALEIGIAEVRDGARLGDIGGAIQEYVEAQGCSVVRDFVGHGIGRRFHEDPQVKHYGKRGSGERLKAGMIFTIEPMVNLGRFEVVVDPDDKWTVTTVDGSLSAQFEHTCLVTKSGVEILTKRPKPLRLSENVAAVLA
jgi:methionyl aminopeptidase